MRSVFKENELALIRIIKKDFLICLKKGAVFHTNKGYIRHDDIIGKPEGIKLFTSMNKPAWVFRPLITDLLMSVYRVTNITYPKELAFIILKLGINAGKKVLEAGTGSGALTMALAYFVSPNGKVVSYERRPEFTERARENIAKAGLEKFVDLRIGDISQGIFEKDFDCCILDLPEPWECLEAVSLALKPGAPLAIFLPTVNQVERTVLKISEYDFLKPEVAEVLLRTWDIKKNASRPDFQMIGHTGFVITTRKLASGSEV